MPATVDVITESDIADVAAFLARQARAGEAIAPVLVTPERRLRWLLLENPNRARDIPLGWRIRSETGAVVGASVCIPYRIGAGEFTTTALMFAKFFVDPEYRGMGLGIFMRFVRQGRRFPLFSTSTNAKSGELFSRFGGNVIAGMDHTMLGIRRPKPLIEEWLYRKTQQPTLAKLLAIPSILAPGRKLMKASRDGIDGNVEFRRLKSVDEAMALKLPASTGELSIVRDRDYLHWRYFAGESENHVHRLRGKDNCDRLVVVNEIRSGHRGQIRVLNVLDVWPPSTAESACDLAGALSKQYGGSFDTIWLRGQPRNADEALEALGFMRHDFPAPLGWCIDVGNQLPTGEWYLMPGESE